MGVRFYCPNGHRLHVKSFLAGKRGICPHCEIGFRIPAESNIPRGSPKVLPGSLAAHGTNGKRATSLTTAVKAQAEASLEVAVKASPSRAKDPISEALGIEVAVKAKATPATPDQTQKNPIDDAPEAVWYVRPPAGGQFGPAKGDVMRKWIAEGRVSHDSLVWREGWAEWQSAGPLFPALNPTYTAPASTNRRQTVSLQLQPVSSAVDAARPADRTASKSKSLAAVIILVLMVVVLLTVFVVVLMAK